MDAIVTAFKAQWKAFLAAAASFVATQAVPAVTDAVGKEYGTQSVWAALAVAAGAYIVTWIGPRNKPVA